MVGCTKMILGPMRESPNENGGSWPQQELSTARVFRVVPELHSTTQCPYSHRRNGGLVAGGGPVAPGGIWSCASAALCEFPPEPRRPRPLRDPRPDSGRRTIPLFHSLQHHTKNTRCTQLPLRPRPPIFKGRFMHRSQNHSRAPTGSYARPQFSGTVFATGKIPSTEGL